MKKVLILDEHTLFRDFLKQKLAEDQLEVIVPQDTRAYYTKLISVLPNLVILDMEDDNYEQLAFLEKKGSDFNTMDIPVIVTGPKQEKANIAALAKYGVIKYFEKPIQFDVFFEAIGKVLHLPLSLDTTPCVLDLHRNDSIIFVELALGLNREKIALLQYKLTEMIETQNIDTPKIVMMLTNLELSFIDGYNLEFLIDNILACPKVRNKNVKILSLSQFVRDMVDGHPNYSEIEIVNNLAKVLNSLVDTSITSSVSDLITDKILATTNEFETTEGASIDTRFSSDSTSEKSKKSNSGTVVNLAIIDSNPAIMEQTKQAFVTMGISVSCYPTGKAFMDDYAEEKFNLVIMDIFLSDNTGIQVLQFLQRRITKPSILVYSGNLQKEYIVKALSLGAKGYVVKPQRPNVLVQKALALLK